MRLFLPYLLLGDGIVPHFNEITGVELKTRATAKPPLEVIMGDSDATRLPLWSADDLIFETRGAEVLGTRAYTGTPVFWRHAVGAGKLIVYAAPLEVALTLQPDAFDADAPPFWRVYEEIAHRSKNLFAVTIASPTWLSHSMKPLADG